MRQHAILVATALLVGSLASAEDPTSRDNTNAPKELQNTTPNKACERALNPPRLWASNFPQFCRAGLPPRAFPVGWVDTIAANASPLGGREQHGGHSWGAHDDPGTTSAGAEGIGHCPSTRHRSQDRPQIYLPWPGA